MAELTGKGGSISFTGLTVSVFSWSLNDDADLKDKTDFADAAAGYRTKIAGVPDWSVTVEARYDSTNTADPGDSALLTLTVTTGSDYTGTAMIASMSISEPVDDLVTATYEFVANGVLNRPS